MESNICAIDPHFCWICFYGLNSQSSGLGCVMRVFVPTRVLRVLALRTQSGLVLGSPLSHPGLPARITSVIPVPACPGAGRELGLIPTPTALPPPTRGLLGARSREVVQSPPALLSARPRGDATGRCGEGGSPWGAGTELEGRRRYLFYELIFRSTWVWKPSPRGTEEDKNWGELK